HTLDRGNIHGRGQVIDHGVEHTLNTFVLERRTAEHGLDFAGDGTQTETQIDHVFGQLDLLEIFVHELFVGFSSRLNEFFAPFFGGILEFGGNVDVVELGTLGGFVPDDAAHLDQINNTLEAIFSTDR